MVGEEPQIDKYQGAHTEQNVEDKGEYINISLAPSAPEPYHDYREVEQQEYYEGLEESVYPIARLRGLLGRNYLSRLVEHRSMERDVLDVIKMFGKPVGKEHLLVSGYLLIHLISKKEINPECEPFIIRYTTPEFRAPSDVSHFGIERKLVTWNKQIAYPCGAVVHEKIISVNSVFRPCVLQQRLIESDFLGFRQDQFLFCYSSAIFLITAAEGFKMGNGEKIVKVTMKKTQQEIVVIEVKCTVIEDNIPVIDGIYNPDGRVTKCRRYIPTTRTGNQGHSERFCF